MSSSQPPVPKSARPQVEFFKMSTEDEDFAYNIGTIFATRQHMYLESQDFPDVSVGVVQLKDINPPEYLARVKATFQGDNPLRAYTKILKKSSIPRSTPRESLEDLQHDVETGVMKISPADVERLGQAGFFNEETVRELEGILRR